jgi:hypothetical protein
MERSRKVERDRKRVENLGEGAGLTGKAGEELGRIETVPVSQLCNCAHTMRFQRSSHIASTQEAEGWNTRSGVNLQLKSLHRMGDRLTIKKHEAMSRMRYIFIKVPVSVELERV